MSDYRLRIDEIKGSEVVTSYTRWLASVEARGSENQEVYSRSGPRFELGLRSKHALRLYAWAKKYASLGRKRISLEQLRKVFGLDSVKDAEGNVIQEAPLPIWANFRQRSLDPAIAEITRKTDMKIAIESLERSKHRKVTS